MLRAKPDRCPVFPAGIVIGLIVGPSSSDRDSLALKARSELKAQRVTSQGVGTSPAPESSSQVPALVKLVTSGRLPCACGESPLSGGKKRPRTGWALQATHGDERAGRLPFSLGSQPECSSLRSWLWRQWAARRESKQLNQLCRGCSPLRNSGQPRCPPGRQPDGCSSSHLQAVCAQVCACHRQCSKQLSCACSQADMLAWAARTRAAGKGAAQAGNRLSKLKAACCIIVLPLR